LNLQSPKEEAVVVVLKFLVFDEVKGDGATHSEIHLSYCMTAGPVLLFYFDVHDFFSCLKQMPSSESLVVITYRSPPFFQSLPAPLNLLIYFLSPYRSARLQPVHPVFPHCSVD
jgi:hypothetical protein